MKVLSLFDGMSCGQIAFNRIGLKPELYFASEIKPHAIKCTQENYPNTRQIGDVTKIHFSNGNIVSEKRISHIGKIDVLIGGSPCQGFSFAGKQLNFEDPRSVLFFEYVRILKEIKKSNPDIFFLLENVKMKKEYQDIISETLGVEPININSKKVSAQMRNRFYWTNIPGIEPIQEKEVDFQSILTHGYTPKKKAFCILEGESRPHATNWRRFYRWKKKSFVNIVFEDEQMNIFRNRFLNQTELERLQTVPDGYTSILTRNEAASLIGDGWTIDVICHILKPLKEIFQK